MTKAKKAKLIAKLSKEIARHKSVPVTPKSVAAYCEAVRRILAAR